MVRSFNTRLKFVVGEYIKLLKVKVTVSSVVKDLEEHPYYPSLLSACETFSKYNIANEAYRLGLQDIGELSPPFVALMYMPGVGKDFALITDYGEKGVTVLYKNSRHQMISLSEFARSYKNVVWIANPVEESIEANYEGKVKKEKMQELKRRLTVCCISVLVVLAFFGGMPAEHTMSYLMLTPVKIAGIIITTLLLGYEINKDNSVVKGFCNTFKQTKCDLILSKKISRIGGVSWSEIGFIYFVSTFLILVMPGMPYDQKVGLLSFFNIMAIPFTFFSIYYQWRIARNWCLLCLMTQAVLVCELCWSALDFWQQPHYSFQAAAILTATFCMLLPSTAWFLLKQPLTKAADHRSLLPAYKRTCRSSELFKAQLLQMDRAPGGYENLGIVMGHPDAAHVITKVCNPFCGHCSRSHAQLHELIKNNKNVAVRVIFLTSAQKEDVSVKVAIHFLAIAGDEMQSQTQTVLDDWYLSERKDYAGLSLKYPIPVDSYEKYLDHILWMKKWCEKANVTHTPTLFVNGYLLPYNYEIEDLNYVLS